MTTYKEYDPVLTTVPLSGEDVFDPAVIHNLPAGQPGAIVDIYRNGERFDVEFVLGERNAEGFIEDPQYCQLLLGPDQIRLDPASASRASAGAHRGR